MRSIGRVAVYVLAFLTLPLGVGVVCLRRAIDAYMAPSPPSRVGADHIPEPPVIDQRKPTVAVVLGKDITEVADALAPYAVFQRSGVFNVVMVAEQRRPVALTGGLDLLPHYSFAELDAQSGAGPALIVVPNIPNVRENETLRLWVQRHGHQGSLVMSVCAGAAMLAATGLIDGQPATTHWGDIARIESQYPAVTWLRGERYIDNGKVISTAGILSGVDGSLHMIDRLRGRALALDVARQMHYTDVRFLDNPSIEQFRVGPADAIILLNAAFLWDRPTLGVALYDGMDEVALAAVYDTYGIVDRLLSLAPEGTVITTRRGLNLVARRAPGDWSTSLEILVPGRKASPTIAWLAPFDVTYTLATEDRFPFGPAIEDIARRHNLPTAQFAAKRLEFRMSGVSGDGRGWWSMAVVYRPLALGILGVAFVWGLKRFLRYRRRNSSRSGMNPLHRELLEREIARAKQLMASGHHDDAFPHLERAHVLGQAHVRWHVLCHWLMLKVAIRRGEPSAAIGQVTRIVLGALGSAVGKVPTGNTGGSNVSMFKQMSIDSDLSRAMEGAS